MPSKPPTTQATSAHAHSAKPDHPNHEGRIEESQQITPLLTAAQVGAWLNVKARRVYDLPIRQLRISDRSIRWNRRDVLSYIERSTSEVG